MKTLLHLLPFEFSILWRSNTLMVLVLAVFGFGIYGIYFGKFEIDKQTERISKVQQYEKQHFDSLIIWASLDTTLAENKTKFTQAVSPVGVGWNKHFTYYIGNEAPPLAGLCLGQRDLYPVYYGINVTDMARQVNVGELANPMKLLTGNFDFSYVIVFLFPLLIIVLLHNLYSAEKEGGTLSLLHAQAAPLWLILFSKGFLRLLLVMLLALVLLMFGFAIQGISFTENINQFFSFLFLIYGYFLFWGVLMMLVIMMQKSSSLSAILGFGLWLMLTLITPSLLNLVVSAKETLPNRAEVIHLVREKNDKNWESPKSFVLAEFYKDYPQFNDGDTVDFYKWYYASFTLLDKEAGTLNSKFEEQIARRNALFEKWTWLTPAALLHEEISQLSKTDRTSHLEFLKQVHQYHKFLKDIYYTRIFEGENFNGQDLRALEQKL